MYLQLYEIIKDAGKLPLIPLTAASAYEEKIPLLTQYVNEVLAAEPAINTLIGNHPLQIMFDNHRHHAAFMATVFTINNYELLARTIPWVYRTYAAHNFSHHYFVLELKTWLLALDQYIDYRLTEEIKSVYRWMLGKHENMIYLSQTEIIPPPPISDSWLERKNAFQAALLEGNHQKCLEIATESIKAEKGVEHFYLYIIQPVMYEVGMLWERGIISVAQEHLASAIVGRVMAATGTVKIKYPQTKGKAVVTSAPNEFHEIGAWMISDILEHDGWQVRYLGANTPLNDLLELLHSFQPEILALSVTMPFNLGKAKEIISAVKEDTDLSNIRIMVGGRPFTETIDLWQSTGADGFAANGQEAKKLAAAWSRHEKR